MKYLLYNGVQLPELPEWDKEVYPYAVIYTYHGASERLNPVYRLVLSDTPFVIVKLTLTKYNSLKWAGSYIAYWKTAASDNWGGDGSGANGSIKGLSASTDAVVWTNSDVLYANDYSGDTSLAGTIYIAASDPVPVTTLTARDLYRKINGKPTKLTLYKKVGGKLIPLDEHTKEVKT